MIYSRIFIGLAAAISMAGPLAALAQLRYDNEVHDFRKSFHTVGDGLPLESELFLTFAPIDWWSFASPIAVGVAVAAGLSSRWPIRVSAALFALSIVQLIAYRAAWIPYAKLMKVIGVLSPSPYPTDQLIANASLVGVTIGIAILSVARAEARRRASKLTTIAESGPGE